MPGQISYSLARAGSARKTKDCVLEPLTEAEELERGVVDSNWCSKLFLALLWTVGVGLIVSLVSIIVYVEFFYKWRFPLRIDCNLDGKLDFNKCLSRGCKYVVTDEKLPICFFPPDHGYIKVGSEKPTSNGFTAMLYRDSKRTVIENEFDYVQLQVFYETRNRIRFQIVPANGTRYKVTVLPDYNVMDTQPSDPLYHVTCQDGKPFGIKVHRSGTGTVLFDSALPGMVLSDQFLQVSSRMATSNLFAFGRRSTKQNNLGWENWTLFSKAHKGNDINSPSVHPFYMIIENDGKAHGVLLLNSNAIDMSVQPEKVITFRAIGGVLDFYLLVGASPAEVLQQFMQLVGRPFMPPQWALGIQLMVSSEADIDAVEDMLDLLKRHEVLVDATQVANGQQMKQSTTNLASRLNARGIKLLRTTNAFVNVTEENKGLLIYRNNYGAINASITEDIAFIDFSNKKAVEYWIEKCKKLYDDIEYDGLVLNSNEPSYPPSLSWTSCSNNTWNNPPYSPGGDVELFHRSVCGDSQESGGKHYDLHNIYGHMHATATWKAIQEIAPGKRPVIISRSTFVGSGKYAGHLHSSNGHCSGEALRASITSVIALSLVGIPYSGFEVPYGIGDCSDTLRDRWLQTAAFFPLFVFPLHHKLYDPQSLRASYSGASLSVAAVASTTKGALKTRHMLTPYLYTLFFEASMTGSPVARPLFYEFPQDENVFRINQQFMLGKAILISPAVDEVDNLEAYLPSGTWFELTTGKATVSEKGTFITLDTALNPHVHIRGGHIVPLQGSASEQNALKLLIAPDIKGSASGNIFLDDKETYRDDLQENSQQVSFMFHKDNVLYTLTTKAVSAYGGSHARVVLNDIRVCGIARPSRIEVDDNPLTTNSFTYSKENVLHLHSLALELGNFTITITVPSSMNVY